MPLLGVHPHTVGRNGRIIIPAKLREDLGEDFVVSAAFDPDRLHLFPMSRWLEIEERIREKNPFAEETTKQANLLGANSALCSQDKQGRTTLPPALLARVGIRDEIVSVGAIDRILVYSKEAYESRLAETENERRELKEGL